MKKKHAIFLSSITIFFVLAAAIFIPVHVSADDDIPATAEPAETVEPAETQEPAATQVPSAMEEPVTDLLPILQQLPEDTAVVVYDENGDILPLASQAAADALAEPDPQFCPAGLPPLDPGCSPVRATIAQAVTDAYAAGGDGTIYVEAGTFTEDVTIDGSLFAGVAPAIFSVSGAGSGLTILDGFIEILNMNSLTLSGLTINQYVEVHNNTGALNLTDIAAGVDGGVSGGFAIVDVYNHDGSITLTDVAANNGSDYGAHLDNTSGTGDITVDNSNFNNNVLGMEVYSAGNITLTDTVANSNTLNGTYLDTSAGTGTISVTNSTFNTNNLYGLVNYSGGDIMLDGVVANNNVNFNGLYIDAATYGTGDITILNSTASGNGYNGLDAVSNGALTLDGVTIDNSGNSGAVIDNAGGTANILVNNSSFDTNAGAGLQAYTSGNITIDNTSADDNVGSDGFYLDSLNGTGDINVTNSTVTGNGNQGLNIGSGGSILLDTVTSSGNAANGVAASVGNNAESITINNSILNGNTGYGLQSITPGSLTLNGVTAGSNTAGGISIDNTLGTGNIAVDNSNFNGNGGYGFQAITSGAATITGVIANNNGTAGLIVDASSGMGDISVTNGTFNGNALTGMILTSNGNVLVDGVTASNNTANDGAFISAAGNIGVRCSSFENNGGYGVNNSNGSPMTFDSAITLSANGLGGYNGSVLIDTSSCGNTATPTVTLTFTATSTPTSTLTSTPTATSTPTGSVPATPSTGGAGNGGRPLHMVPVTGDPLIDLPTDLDCVRYRGTRLILSTDDSVVFLCPLQSTARLDTLPINPLPGGLPVELPAELPQDTTFISGFVSHLIRSNNKEQTTLLARAALVSFTIPEALLETNTDLVILFWDVEEETWLEVDPGIDTGDKRYDSCVKTLMGRFDDPVKNLFHLEACVDYTGMFVLASR